jgi:repressor LexA
MTVRSVPAPPHSTQLTAPEDAVLGAPDGPQDDGKEPLTERQQKVLEFIASSIERRGYPPTLREIGEHMGIRSTNGVNDHLKALEKKGYLEREDLKSRALRPISLEGAGPTGQMVEVPILGRVAAGEPILAVEEASDTVKVDRFFLGANREVFALKVKGDSMINAGIFDGDYIFVKKQLAAKKGDIVVAMIDNEATVKYFHPEPEKDQIVFMPANDRLQPIVVRKRDWKSVNLIGLVVGVYRRM